MAAISASIPFFLPSASRFLACFSASSRSCFAPFLDSLLILSACFSASLISFCASASASSISFCALALASLLSSSFCFLISFSTCSFIFSAVLLPDSPRPVFITGFESVPPIVMFTGTVSPRLKFAPYLLASPTRFSRALLAAEPNSFRGISSVITYSIDSSKPVQPLISPLISLYFISKGSTIIFPLTNSNSSRILLISILLSLSYFKASAIWFKVFTS